MRLPIMCGPRTKLQTQKITAYIQELPLPTEAEATEEKPLQQQKERNKGKIQIRVRPKRVRHKGAAEEVSTQNTKAHEKQNVSKDATGKDQQTKVISKEQRKIERRARRKYLRKLRRRPKGSKEEQKKIRRRRQRRHRHRRRRHRRHSTIGHVLAMTFLFILSDTHMCTSPTFWNIVKYIFFNIARAN